MTDEPILIRDGKEAPWRNARRADAIISDAVRKKGKDVLEELLTMLVSMVEQFRPWPPERGTNPNEDRALFDRYVVLATKCAAELAPYQSPKAVIIKHDRPPEDEPDLTKLSDEELQQWRRLLLKFERGPTS
jgi:hypothetical protein